MSVSKGWKTVRLGDVAKCITGGTPSKKDKANYGTYLPLIKPTQLTDGLITEVSEYLSEQGAAVARILPPNSVLVSCIGYLGKTGINSAPVAFNQQINAAIFDDEVEPKFGFYFMQSLSARNQLEKLASATTISIVNKSKFQSVNIPIPETIEEQRQIVAEIEKQFARLDAGVDGLKRVQANLKRYRASVLKAACSGQLVPTEAALTRGQRSEDGSQQEFEAGEQLLERILIERRKAHEEQQKTAPRKKKYKEPAAPAPLSNVKLPEGWVWTGFEEISSGERNAIKAGPFGSALKKSFYTPTGYKIYGQEQVINGDPYFGDYFISEERYESLKSCAVQPGDILISLVGTTGKVLILPPDCASGIINPRLLKVSINHDGAVTKFIKIVLEAPQTKAFFKLAAHGGTMDVLNLTILKSLPIALPTLAEQKRIVEEVERRLSVIEEMETAVEANLKRANRLRQSILKKAFEGKLV